jgi:hypothetical protein
VSNSGNGIVESFTVSWTVKPALYSITLSNAANSNALDGTHGYIFSFAASGYGTQTALSVTVTNTGNQPTGNLTASESSGNFTITPTGGSIASLAVSGTSADAFTVQPKGSLDAGSYTAVVTVSNSGNGISESFPVSFMVGDWLGGDWSPSLEWGAWTDDTVVPDSSDPTSAYPPTVSSASTWVEVVNADIDAAGILTIAVDGTGGTFTISGDNATGPLVPSASYSLSTVGVRFIGVNGNKNIVVDAASGANPSNPLNIELVGVTISVTSHSSPFWLMDGANVLLNIVSDSVLTSASSYRRYPGLRVPGGTKIEITSSTGASLLAQNTGTSQSCGAGIGSYESGESTGTIVINGDVIVTAIAATGSNGGAGIGSGCSADNGGTISIGGSAQVTATGSVGGGGAGICVYGGMVNIGGSAQVTATGRLNAGIGGLRGGGSTITIGGNALVYATGSGDNGAGINSCGSNGVGGTTTIGGNALVYATGAGSGGGIGHASSGPTTIGGNALVYATGGSSGGAGIGGSTITIGGNALVFATGGGNGAGIGSSGSVGIITISGGIVIARTSGTASRAAAIGAGGHATNSYAAGKITISGGFVLAQSENPDAPDIGASAGYIGAWVDAGNSVTISGGSLYATSAKLFPAPRNAAGTTVYPLYAPAALSQKTISVTNPAYTARTIGKTAARFLATGLFTPSGADQFPSTAVTDIDGIFPAAISATLWLPAATYTGITNSPASGDYAAEVQASVVPYSEGGANRLLR